MKRVPRSRRSAFTLLEWVIALTLTTLLGGSLALVTSSSADAFRTNRATHVVDQRLRRALTRIADELVMVRRAGLVPDPAPPFGSPDLTYQHNLGYDGAALTWTTDSNLAWRRDPGEWDDGIDNDGDGLVDEGRIERTRDQGEPGQRTEVWVHGVSEYLEGEVGNGLDDNGNGLIDERGLSFALEGDTLVVRLGLEGRDHKGRSIRRTMSTTLTIRN